MQQAAFNFRKAQPLCVFSAPRQNAMPLLAPIFDKVLMLLHMVALVLRSLVADGYLKVTLPSKLSLSYSEEPSQQEILQ